MFQESAKAIFALDLLWNHGSNLGWIETGVLVQRFFSEHLASAEYWRRFSALGLCVIPQAAASRRSSIAGGPVYFPQVVGSLVDDIISLHRLPVATPALPSLNTREFCRARV
jgi:hypothetical protein